jgi:hypothetical protein
LDCFFCDGVQILFHICLALLAKNQETLLVEDDTLSLLQTLKYGLDMEWDQVFEVCIPS